MELAQLFPIAIDVRVTLPSGEETDVILQVVGEDSPTYRTGAKAIAAVFQAPEKPSLDVLERLNNTLFASCIVGWRGLQENGQDAPYSKEKALELMSDPRLTFMRQQVEAAVARRAEFFRRSPVTA